jgi:hypothetical protein
MDRFPYDAGTREKQLVAALRDGRVAIDVLMARLIEVDPSFLSTRSPAWPALMAIKAALDGDSR